MKSYDSQCVDQASRSLRPDVRNPMLKLPGVVKLQGLPSPVREALIVVLMDIRKDAHANAEKCWTKHKSPMACYWKVVAVYAGHIARAIRSQQARFPFEKHRTLASATTSKPCPGCGWTTGAHAIECPDEPVGREGTGQPHDGPKETL